MRQSKIGIFRSLLENSTPPNRSFREFLIDGRPIAPCLCCISVIKELIKAGDLGRLKGLVRDQRSLQDPECGSAQCGAWNRLPGNPEFRVELVLLPNNRTITAQEVGTEPNSKRHVL